MIVFTTQPRGSSTLLSLHGDLEPEDSLTLLVDHLSALATSTHLVIDLTGLDALGAATVTALSRRLPVTRIQQHTRTRRSLPSTDTHPWGLGGAPLPEHPEPSTPVPPSPLQLTHSNGASR